MYEELRTIYNPEGSATRKMQMEFLVTMLEFDAFAKSHDIKYSLGYGSLLGAVRHQGFIPWDDDVDIVMMHDEFDKLVALVGESGKVCGNISLNWDGTRAVLWVNGVNFIDIFIWDSCPDNVVLAKIKQWCAQWVSLQIKCKERINQKRWKPMKPWFVLMPFAVLHSHMNLHRRLMRICRWFDNPNSKRVASYNSTVANIAMTYPRTAVAEYVDMDFEGHKLPCFADFDTLLSIRYGDYMSIPQERFRKVHNRG